MTDLISVWECLAVMSGELFIIIKGILGEDQSINDLEYGRRIG